MNNDCLKIERAMGWLDPDGNKWIIGNPQGEVQFQKCYFKWKQLNFINNGTI